MKILRIIKISLLIALLILLSKIFLPRHYIVTHLQQRENTKYWNLTTGSTIAFTHLQARGIAKPFPIIYLTGGPGGVVTDQIIKSISALTDNGYSIYFYDQAGSGLSARLDNINEYSPERHIKDLAEIIQKTGAEKVILLGQSWGAVLAVLFTADYPSLVDRIIFAGPGPVYPLRKELSKLSTPDSLQLRKPYYSNEQGNAEADNIRTKAIRFFAEKLGWKIASDNEADEFADFLSCKTNRSTVCDTSMTPIHQGGAGYYAQMMTMKHLPEVKDPRPKLSNTAIPVLIIKGQCDNQPWGFTSEYLQLFRNHELTIIQNAGHFSWIEQPELYLKTIRSFLITEFDTIQKY